MKIRHGLFLIVYAGVGSLLLGDFSAHADELSFNQARVKAQEYQDKAQSSIVNTQENGWAQYYQNVQIIDLLSEIREDLKEMRIHLEEVAAAKKETSPSNPRRLV